MPEPLVSPTEVLAAGHTIYELQAGGEGYYATEVLPNELTEAGWEREETDEWISCYRIFVRHDTLPDVAGVTEEGINSATTQIRELRIREGIGIFVEYHDIMSGYTEILPLSRMMYMEGQFLKRALQIEPNGPRLPVKLYTRYGR